MTWLDEEWVNCLKAVCDHSESIAELGWVVLKMSVKSSEGWKLDVIDDVAQPSDAPYPSSLTISFLFILPSACLSLASHIFLPSHQYWHPWDHLTSQKDVPPQPHQTPYSSKVMIAYLEVRIYHKNLGQLALKFDSCVVHTASDPVVDVIRSFYPDKAHPLPTSVMSSPTWYGLWGRRTWRE